MSKKVEPKSATSKATVSASDLIARVQLAADAIGLPADGAPEPLDRATIGQVLAAVVQAMADPSPAWARTLAAMADIARGAVKPGDTFNAELVRAVACADSVVRIRIERKDPMPMHERFFALSRSHAFLAKLLEGLDDASALESLRATFGLLAKNKHRKPSGVVIDLLFAAIQRGVKFEGSTLSSKSPRTAIATLVGSAIDRAKERSAGE